MAYRLQENVQLWKRKFDLWRVKREGLDADLDRLEREGYASLTPEEHYRLKMSGVCSQRTPGLHMIRIRIPGGRISADQLRSVAEISEHHADGGAHITTRQNIELHSVPSADVKTAVTKILDSGLTTRSSCGHTVRNIVGCSVAGVCAEEVFDTTPTVTALNDFFITRASHYNARFPSRLNIYVSGCPRCMAHAQVNDLGFVATRRGGEEGFQLWCAGSSSSNPRIAELVFAFVPRQEVVAVAQAVADVYCEHGFKDRPANKARLKFLVREWGIEAFTAAVLEQLGTLRPSHGVSVSGAPPIIGPDRRPPGGHRGIFPQRQPGYVRIEVRARLGDLDGVQMQLLAGLAESYGDGIVYLTREQNAELHWIADEFSGEVAAALQEVGLMPAGAGGLVDVQVCAGSEWCIFGLGDSRGLARDIESSLADVVAADPNAEPLKVAVSGCHRSCAPHQVADVGLAAVKVGEGAGFEVFGGGRLGPDPVTAQKLGRVPLAETPGTMIGLLKAYLAERDGSEDFSEFVERAGKEVLRRPRVFDEVEEAPADASSASPGNGSAETLLGPTADGPATVGAG